MKKFVVMAALGAALLPAAALGQGGGGGMMQKDQTRAEAQQRSDMLFQMLDANHDGTVTRDEANQALANFQAARGGDDNGHRGGRLQAMIDQAFGTSQSLTLQQFEAQSLARFDAADANHDGVVTAAERQAARGQQAAPAKTVAQSPITTPVKPQ